MIHDFISEFYEFSIEKNFIHLCMIHDQKIAFETARYLLQINAIKLNPKNHFSMV